jgi:predicted HicB family RNase H-like nuclease
MATAEKLLGENTMLDASKTHDVIRVLDASEVPDADVVIDADVVNDADVEARVYQAAYDMYLRDPDWMVFYRKVLGLKGLMREAFSEQKSLAIFEETPAYAEILQMLTNLRQRRRPAPTHEERIRVITVRLPESLHEALKDEAHVHRTSMNQLCISKLLKIIENDMIPNDG